MLVIIIAVSYLATSFLMPHLVRLIKPRLASLNYKNQEVPLGLGIVFVIVVVPAILSLVILRNLTLLVGFLSTTTIFGFGGVGFIDDTLGSREARGFAGHFRSLIQGHLTTGALKALFGGVIALLVALIASDGVINVICNALNIALFANLINLLDVRPGRAGKFFIIIAIIFSLFGILQPVLLTLLACVLAYLPWDLRTHVMMGDVGANVLGAVLGLASCTLPVVSKLLVLVGLIVVHIYAERYSLTKLIERNKYLNAFDRIGRG